MQFALRGCKKLFLVDISPRGLEQTEALIQEKAPSVQISLCQTDITKEDEVARMVKKCVEQYGRIDFASNNAGIASGNTKTADMTMDAFDKICDVNERGVCNDCPMRLSEIFQIGENINFEQAFYCEKHEIIQMLKQDFLPIDSAQVQRGTIVNMASLCGIGVVGSLSAYNSSKHAVVQMSAVDAREYAPMKIRINTVCPGVVNTPMLTGSNLTQSFLDALKAQCPMNRLMEPREIANGVLFLSSSLASGITGINLSIDGGGQLYHVV